MVVAAALPAQAAGPQAISKCSDNHSYGYGTVVVRDSYLTKDLTCQKGFVVTGGATLDLHGHTLTGKPDPYTCVGGGCPEDGLHDQPGHAAIVLDAGRVENGRLDGWDFGVRIFTGDGSSPRSISRLAVTNMALSGVYAMDNEDTVTVSRSLFRHDGIGVDVVLGGGYKIDRTTFADNAGAGVESVVGSELTVTRSTFTGNGAAGLYSAFGRGPSTITGNVFHKNKGDGLNFSSSGATRVGKNVATKNGGHGMVFTDADVTDLGGNRASRNRTEPQCVGVPCR